MEAPHFGAVRNRWLAICLAMVFSLALAVASTWPLTCQLSTSLPLGSEDVTTVQLFNVWTVWWNGVQAGRGWNGYFDAPIFAPEKSTFLFSEMQPVTALVAPISHDPAHATLAYNVYLLASLTLNSFTAWLFASRLTGCRITGIIAGTMVGLLPFAHWQLGVLQLIPVWPSVMVLHSFLRYSETCCTKWSLACGAFSAWAYLSCNYYGLFLAFLIPFYVAPLLISHFRNRRMWLGLLGAAGLFLILAWPAVSRQLAVAGDHTLRRSLETIWHLSAASGDYWHVARASATTEGFIDVPGHPLSPGKTVCLLAVAGLVLGIRRSTSRRVTLALCLFATVAFLLSLGPRWHIFGRIPFMYLADFVPGFGQIRSPFRAAVFVQISVIMLSCPAIATLIAISRSNGGTWKKLCGTLLCLSCAFAFWEVWPRACPLRNVPVHLTEGEGGWQDWIGSRTPENAILLQLPVAAGGSVVDYEPTTVGMFYAMWHRRRLANGYSGFFPESYQDLREQFSETSKFEANELLTCLRSRDVDYCVVQLSSVWLKRFRQMKTMTLVFSDRANGIFVFQVNGVAHENEGITE